MALSSLLNSGVPKSMTYIAQNQSRSKMKRYKTGGTNGITSIHRGRNLRVLHPGLLEPSTTSLRPCSPSPYSKGLRIPGGGLSFRNEVIKQGVYARYCLGISSQMGAWAWAVQDRWGSGMGQWNCCCCCSCCLGGLGIIVTVLALGL